MASDRKLALGALGALGAVGAFCTAVTGLERPDDVRVEDRSVVSFDVDEPNPLLLELQTTLSCPIHAPRSPPPVSCPCGLRDENADSPPEPTLCEVGRVGPGRTPNGRRRGSTRPAPGASRSDGIPARGPFAGQLSSSQPGERREETSGVQCVCLRSSG